MNLLRYFLLITLSMASRSASGQQVAVSVAIRFGKATLELQQPYLLAGDSICFEKVRFYISGMRLLYQGKIVTSDRTAAHLIDASEAASMHWQLATDTPCLYDEVQLLVGTDSLTNVSGAQSGDLDPVKGMYWTWQSGYINIKAEGYSSKCLARNHKFQYHLGGYQGAFASQQQWSARTKPGSEIQLLLRLDQWCAGIPMNRYVNIMSPSATAVELAAQFAQNLHLEP